MLELGARLEQDFNRRFVDTALPVLWEDSRRVGKDLLWTGLTGNYIRVTTETRDGIDLTNTVTDTTIFSTVPGGVVGMIDGMSVRDAIAGRELPLIQTL
jgi:hypothetical protein